MVIDKEKQGPGRAYWFSNVEEAVSFANEKKAKGHIVSMDEKNNYVWHSFSRKNHSHRALLVEWGYDTLAV